MEKFVAEDRRLEAAASQTSEALMRHRWHWTLDESNPERVSMRQYAQAVGRNLTTIRSNVNGYVLLQSERGTAFTPAEARERAGMGVETELAAEAVADARGTGIQQARKTRPTEVRRVREIARQRAEDKGTSVEEEAPKVAEWIVKSEQADRELAADRKARSSLRYIEAEGYGETAKRVLLKWLNLARDQEWSNEEIELLTATLANVRALLNLIDLAMSGAAEIDWDGELASLTKES